jgi:outer membrane protein OmpA-like peptidoglycan-associated protein
MDDRVIMQNRNERAGLAAARWWLIVIAAMASIASAVAQEATVPSPAEIIRKLTQPQLKPEDLRSNAVRVEGSRRRADAGSAASIDLAVNFEYASATLTPDARIVLDNLGQALADAALRDARFGVAGHTDARGGDAYNLNLSRLRARAVADYLKQQHGIDARRLVVEGFGRSRLLDPANPDSAVNRRVQVTNLGQ